MRFPLLAKAAAVGLIVLVLALMLTRVDGLVAERRARQQAAMA